MLLSSGFLDLSESWGALAQQIF